jgi:Rrf2 family transcriptional regulator, nitric oxide-sensitive transcriptional repressor
MVALADCGLSLRGGSMAGNLREVITAARAERRAKVAAAYRQKLIAKRKRRQLEEAKRVMELDRNLIVIAVFGISKPHLMKVVNDLSQKGYLDTVRGRNGGIRLMREPRDINIGQVVRDTENQLGVIGCLERKGCCPIERVCVLRGALRNATEAFLAVLDAYTLADFDQAAAVLLVSA